MEGTLEFETVFLGHADARERETSWKSSTNGAFVPAINLTVGSFQGSEELIRGGRVH